MTVITSIKHVLKAKVLKPWHLHKVGVWIYRLVNLFVLMWSKTRNPPVLLRCIRCSTGCCLGKPDSAALHEISFKSRGNSIIIGGSVSVEATAESSMVRWFSWLLPEYYLTETEMEKTLYNTHPSCLALTNALKLICCKFSWIILKCGKDIHCPKISDESNYGGSALLDMLIMDHLMSQPLLAFLNSFFKVKSPNLVQR